MRPTLLCLALLLGGCGILFSVLVATLLWLAARINKRVAEMRALTDALWGGAK